MLFLSGIGVAIGIGIETFPHTLPSTYSPHPFTQHS